MKCPSISELLASKEGENLEFKEAKGSFEFEELVKYACALANSGGGCIALGISDQRPRQVVGSAAFPQPERARAGLIDRLHLRIDFEFLGEPDRRVLVFLVPSRPVGTPVQDRGIYWTRHADSLAPMSEAELRTVFAESGHDFSADVCGEAVWGDLDLAAIEEFRRRWIAKSGNPSLSALSAQQLLADSEAVVRGGITYAALVLFGKREALGRLLGQAEVIFEYRSSEASGPAQQREEFRQGFFSYYERLWELVNLRNTKQHYQDGLFVMDVPTFEERVVREAVLNAVSHRDYQLGGSVFVRQYPQRMVLESPGGLPPGVTMENILDRQSPRNRRIADLFARCGLVERSGQGMNLMFEVSVKQAKWLPSLRGTDQYHVTLTLDGQVHDPRFLELMERIGQETLASFSTRDLLLVDTIYREQPVPETFRDRLPRLVELGVVERASRNRFILARRFYVSVGKKGAYTRNKGLDRETRKALLLRHIAENADEGTRFEELCQVLPGHARSQIQVLLRELQRGGRIHVRGRTKAARWYPGLSLPDRC